MMVIRSKYFAIALLSVALLLSCVKELQGPDVPERAEDQQEEITAVVRYRATVGEGVQTKASLNNLNQYIFETGDQLFITSGNDLYGVLNLVAGAGDPTGTFEGDLMCLNGFEPVGATLLSATLVSNEDKIHSHQNGKITGTSYPTDDNAYAESFPEAIRYFSDFTAVSRFDAHTFSLEQQSTFLIFSITFDDSEAGTINGASSVTATITNNGESLPLRTGSVSVAEIDFAYQANFVAAFQGSMELQQGAKIAFSTAPDNPSFSEDDITAATLQANKYYEVSRSHVDLRYFTIQAKEDGTTTISCKYAGNGIQYRMNGTGDWLPYTSAGTGIELSKKGFVQFRGKLTTFKGEKNGSSPVFSSDKACFVYGDIMSLICNDNYEPKTTLNQYAFQYAFKNVTWIDIPAGRPLKLSASTLNQGCYQEMFYGCTSLIHAPELQTTLTADIPSSAFNAMFQGCTSLASAPDLPTRLSGGADVVVGSSGYYQMFKGCTSLITVPATIVGTSGKQACQAMFSGCTSLANAPALPAMSVGEQGYYLMFQGCSSLVQAPQLPATAFGSQAYQEMFINCTGLVSAPPVLPANTLANKCYMNMFNGCTSLSRVPDVLPAESSESECYRGMFSGCISLPRAPEIKLISIGTRSCQEMFSGCTSLVTATGPEHATSIDEYGCYKMFYNCGELTTTPAKLKPVTVPQEAYREMYSGCAKITEAPDIEATSVASTSCYRMFYGCRRLRKAPSKLDVVVVEEKAFKGMFEGCSALASAPDFPSMTTVNLEGCMDMFNGCSNLTSAPELPATNLAKSAYQAMFKSSGLTAVPELPAMTLAQQCYQDMFQYCRYLEGPAVLPAQELVTECYKQMFDGASILNSVVCLATTNISTANCSKWLRGVSATGTFVRPNGVAWETNAESGIPTGWTAQDTGIDPIFPDGGPFDPEEDL